MYLVKYVTFSMQAEASIRRELESSGITVVSHMFKTRSDPVTTIEDLFVSFWEF